MSDTDAARATEHAQDDLSTIDRLDKALQDWQTYEGNPPEHYAAMADDPRISALRTQARELLAILDRDGRTVAALAEGEGIDATALLAFVLAPDWRTAEGARKARVVVGRVRARRTTGKQARAARSGRR
jgi:hypothetical protein